MMVVYCIDSCLFLAFPNQQNYIWIIGTIGCYSLWEVCSGCSVAAQQFLVKPMGPLPVRRRSAPGVSATSLKNEREKPRLNRIGGDKCLTLYVTFINTLVTIISYLVISYYDHFFWHVTFVWHDSKNQQNGRWKLGLSLSPIWGQLQFDCRKRFSRHSTCRSLQISDIFLDMSDMFSPKSIVNSSQLKPTLGELRTGLLLSMRPRIKPSRRIWWGILFLTYTAMWQGEDYGTTLHLQGESPAPVEIILLGKRHCPKNWNENVGFKMFQLSSNHM